MKKFLLITLLLVALLTACSSSASDSEKHGIGVSQAHIFLPAAKSDGTSDSPVAAAFMTIDNYTGQDDRLIGAKADFCMAEVHEMKMEGDVMQMHQVDGIDIPNDTGIVLESGGYHVMLMGLTGNIKVGEEHTITLVFEKAGEVQAKMLVTAEE